MKKVPILILFIFCLFSLLGGTFLFPNLNFAVADGNNVGEIYYITDVTAPCEAAEGGGYTIGMIEYVSLFYNNSDGINHQKDSIILQKDIDFKNVVIGGVRQDIVLEKTIGDISKPFQGSFNGNGFSFSNLNINLREESSNQYVGLFGNAQDAYFQNVSFTGEIKLDFGNCLASYVGSVVGRADNCTFKNMQLDECSVILLNEFDNNINFGGMIGMAQNCQISNLICRIDIAEVALDRNDNRFHAVGGVAGRFVNSTMMFSVIESKFSVNLASEFQGLVYLGGVVGTVSEGGSKIINAAIENFYDITSDERIVCGEVAGAVLNPSPISEGAMHNLSYIHFKKNANISAFGNENYILDGTNISESAKSLFDGGQEYFDSLSWHPLYGVWDFDAVWYINVNSKIYLQSFIDNFSVRISNSSNDILIGTMESFNFKYGDQAKLSFHFVGNMREFYSVVALNLGNTEVAKIYTRVENGQNVYSLSQTKYYDINSTDDGFEIIVKDVNLSTAGNYTIATTAKTFNITISSKLFEKDEQQVEDVLPGNVFYIVDNYEVNSSSDRLSLNNVRYEQSFRIGTRAKAAMPYAFVGWFVEGQAEPLSLSGILDITFGRGVFVSDLSIYAKYSMNACNVTCKMDKGIVKIVFFDTIVVEQTEQVVLVSKGGQLKIKIFVENGFVFDVDNFIAELDIFKSLNPDVREFEEEGLKCFQLIFDLDKLNEDFLDSFTINARTLRADEGNNSWIWWVVGGVVGAIVLVGLIILIVVLSKHRGGGFGGMGGSGKVSKKAYKNMYY